MNVCVINFKRLDKYNSASLFLIKEKIQTKIAKKSQTSK